MKIWLFIYLPLLVCSLLASQLAWTTETLNFGQALQRAREKSPDYDAAKRSTRNSDLSYKKAWAVLLPQADLQAQHFYNQQGSSNLLSNSQPTVSSLSSATTPWSDLLSLNLTENFYDNGDSLRLMEIADFSKQLGQLSQNLSLQQLFLKVSKAYYAFSAAAGSIELQSQEIKTLRKEFSTIEGRYRQGVSSNRDFLRIKAQLMRSEIEFASRQISLGESLQALRVSIGERDSVDFVPFTPNLSKLNEIEFPVVEPEQALDFRIAHLQNKISDLKYRSVARQNWPRLSLKSAYSYNDPQYIGPSGSGLTPYSNFQVALVLDYSLFDWGIRRHNIEIAENQKTIESDAQEAVRISVQQDLHKLVAQAVLLQQSFQKSQQILKDEMEVYSSLNRGYREGKVSYLELITALGELYSAKAQFLNLQYSLLNERASLAFYQGNLDEVLSSY
jgi:outer membrane protein TolC